MYLIEKIKRNWFAYGIISLNFFISYMGTFYLAHSLLEVNKYIEAIIIGTIPVISSLLLAAIIAKNEEKINDYFKWGVLPILIAEKISIPLYEYLDAKIHGSLERNFGVSSVREFISQLLQGNIGSAYYYNGVYLLITVVITFICFKIIKRSLVINRKKLWIWVIVIHLCTVPVIINLFIPLIKLESMLLWISACFLIAMIYSFKGK